MQLNTDSPTRVNPPPRGAIDPGRPGVWRVAMTVEDGIHASYPTSWQNPALSSLDATLRAIAWAREAHPFDDAEWPPKVRVLEVLQVGV